MTSTPTSTVRALTANVAVFVAYVVSAEVGLALAQDNVNVTAVWPPTGIAVGALLLTGRRVIPAVWAAALAANLLNGAALPLALGISVGNTLAPVAAVAVFRRLGIRTAFRTPGDVIALFAVAAGAMTISASGGVASLWVAGAVEAGDVGWTWLTWWAGDALGTVLVAPVLMSGPELWPTLRTKPHEALAIFATAGLLTWWAFSSGFPLRYGALLVALFAAYWCKQAGAAVATLVISGTAVWATVSYPGADPSLSPTASLVLLQSFNAAVALTALVVAVVVTQRGEAEDRLRDSADELEERVRERTANLTESQRLAHIGSFRWDAATDTNEWTEELYRIYGLDPAGDAPSFERYIGLIDPRFRDEVGAEVQRAVGSLTPFEHEYAIVHPSGEERWVRAFGEPLVGPDGGLAGLQGTCQDITEQRRAQQVVADAYERERKATQHLRMLDRVKTTFLEAVSHELRTPLTVILGVSQLLESEDMSVDHERYEDLVASLNRNAQRLRSLLDDLLDLDRLQRGVVSPRRKPTDMRALVDRVLEWIDDLDHPITTDVDPLVAEIDPAYTERIVENLLSNALKHTPPATPITVAVRTEGDGIDIIVADEGEGIAEDIRAEIFEPFVKNTEDHVAGTGIGLSLVERFTDLHDGSVRVETAPEGGKTFTAHLRCAVEAAPAAP